MEVLRGSQTSESGRLWQVDSRRPMGPYMANGRGRPNSERPYGGRGLSGSRHAGWHCGYLGTRESSLVSSSGNLTKCTQKMEITESGNQDGLSPGGWILSRPLSSVPGEWEPSNACRFRKLNAQANSFDDALVASR